MRGPDPARSSLGLFAAALLLLSCAGSRSGSTPSTQEAVDRPTQVESASGEAEESDKPDSAPEPGEITGCQLRGPLDGELLGEALGEPTDLEAASAFCLSQGKRCRGVTSEWYQGFPWVAVGAGEPFQADSDSYGRTYLRECPEERALAE